MLHTANYFGEALAVRMDREGAPEPGSAKAGRGTPNPGQEETDTWRHAGAIAADIVRRLDRAALLPHRAGPQAPEVPLSRGLRGRQE